MAYMTIYRTEVNIVWKLSNLNTKTLKLNNLTNKDSQKRKAISYLK